MAIELVIVECLEFDGEISNWKEVWERFFDCAKRKGRKCKLIESEEVFEKFYCGENGRKSYKRKCRSKTKTKKAKRMKMESQREEAKIAIDEKSYSDFEYSELEAIGF